jgi:hypothetical protein
MPLLSWPWFAAIPSRLYAAAVGRVLALLG